MRKVHMPIFLPKRSVTNWMENWPNTDPALRHLARRYLCRVLNRLTSIRRRRKIPKSHREPCPRVSFA